MGTAEIAGSSMINVEENTASAEALLERVVGTCPETMVTIAGVPTLCLVDSGSQVTTVTETYFMERLQSKVEPLSSASFVRLRAANGMDIPCVGLFSSPLHIQGQEIPDVHMLVIRDPKDEHGRPTKERVPVVIGCNVLKGVFSLLTRLSENPIELHTSSMVAEVAQKGNKREEFAYSHEKLLEFQAEDPSIGLVLQFFKEGKKPPYSRYRTSTREFKQLMKQWSALLLEHDVLYRTITLQGQTAKQLVLPERMRKEVLQQLHDQHGHQGAERMHAVIQSRFYWPGMKMEAEEYCRKCVVCKVAKRPSIARSTPRQPVFAREQLYQTRKISQHNLQKQAQKRVALHGKKPMLAPIQLGSLVYLRNRVMGRNKIQNHWSQTPYRVFKKLKGKSVYLVYPLTDPRAMKTENRENLLDMSRLLAEQEEAETTKGSVVRKKPDSATSDPLPTSSSSEEMEERYASRYRRVAPVPMVETPGREEEESFAKRRRLVVSTPLQALPPELQVSVTSDEALMDTIPTVGGSVCESLFESSVEEELVVEESPIREVRRSQRTTKGKHSNPFNLPRTAVLKQIEGFF